MGFRARYITAASKPITSRRLPSPVRRLPRLPSPCTATKTVDTTRTSASAYTCRRGSSRRDTVFPIRATVISFAHRSRRAQVKEELVVAADEGRRQNVKNRARSYSHGEDILNVHQEENYITPHVMQPACGLVGSRRIRSLKWRHCCPNWKVTTGRRACTVFSGAA